MTSGRQVALTAVLLGATVLTIGTARATEGVAAFAPAAALSTTLAPATLATKPIRDAAPVDLAPVVELTPQPTMEPTPAPEPMRTAAPVVAPRPVSTPAPPAAPSTCPATWFCYPRLGIAGPIVPYTDCSGSTDVGTAIRSYSCLSDRYLMGHAYTPFGLVTHWIAGDVVFAWGQRYTVSGAVTQQSCQSPTVALAPLSMQTSLTSKSCGAVLVVQAR
jgi:hypothetical protein